MPEESGAQQPGWGWGAGQPPLPVSQEIDGNGWTIGTLKIYYDAVLYGDRRFLEERDRRYTEVGIEREKALKIKETADLAALGLAREIQTYKDEKANELREQISSERGHYASKEDVAQLGERVDLALKPLEQFVTSQRSRGQLSQQFVATLLVVAGLAVSIVVAVVVIAQ